VRKADGKRTKERKPQAQITHRFPAAVDRELFERVNARLSTTAPRGKNTTAPVRSIFAGVLKCQHCGGTVTRVNKGEWVYLVCAAAHAKAGTCRYESVAYEEAEAEIRKPIQHILDDAPRGNDTTQLDTEIQQWRGAIDAGEDTTRELLEVRMSDKSAAAERALRRAERELEEARESLRKLMERRDTLTSTNVKMRLAAVEKALTAEPMDTEAANRALRAAVLKMVMKPAEGTLDIYWHTRTHRRKCDFSHAGCSHHSRLLRAATRRSDNDGARRRDNEASTWNTARHRGGCLAGGEVES